MGSARSGSFSSPAVVWKCHCGLRNRQGNKASNDYGHDVDNCEIWTDQGKLVVHGRTLIGSILLGVSG